MIEFTAAASAMQAAPDGADLCPPFLAVFDVSGVGVSTLGVPLGSSTVCASDVVAERVDEIQLDLGEGPCWEALTIGRPVLEPDLAATPTTRWPAALDEFLRAGVGAVFSFPMRVGTIPVGAVDLSVDRGHVLTVDQVRGAVALTEIAARRVLRDAILAAAADGRADMGAGRYSRREVHQATGMVAAQLDLGVADALLVLQAHAFATERTLRDVAADVIDRRIDLGSEH
ncbi:GAF and ANTAR domain-containing protein [Curtobacterium sp. ZW137]|uniref:GAF and ANTAR domain-containing protein n=1 Tax=Curtobacterium sp. ZW137 TaxID=2485104 RepID=UPI000F4CB5FE|nr:GAF and ANTAR domain-containing protein [Curtobacterium sp. ZW137]ROP61153.1 ANTAR domain-containing protein [Curtobacterium sp. ZW137]